jgi:hypothetical protein
MSDRWELARTLWDQNEVRRKPRLGLEPKSADRARSLRQQENGQSEKDRKGEAQGRRRAGGTAGRWAGDWA